MLVESGGDNLAATLQPGAGRRDDLRHRRGGRARRSHAKAAPGITRSVLRGDQQDRPRAPSGGQPRGHGARRPPERGERPLRLHPICGTGEGVARIHRVEPLRSACWRSQMAPGAGSNRGHQTASSRSERIHSMIRTTPSPDRQVGEEGGRSPRSGGRRAPSPPGGPDVRREVDLVDHQQIGSPVAGPPLRGILSPSATSIT